MSGSLLAGGVVIPAEFRKALGVDIGDDMVMELTNGELRLRSFDAALIRAPEIVRKYVPEGVALADEPIRERHEEAAREEANDVRARCLRRPGIDPGRARRAAGRTVARQAVLSSVDPTEVVTKLVARGVPVNEVREILLWIELFVHAHDEELAVVAGTMHASTRRQGLSLGDRACLALARRLAATALTTDRAWSRLRSASRSR